MTLEESGNILAERNETIGCGQLHVRNHALCDKFEPNTSDSTLKAISTQLAFSGNRRIKKIGHNHSQVKCEVPLATSVPKNSAKTLPFFFQSQFSNVPPTIRFAFPDECKVEKPKKHVRHMLKWCRNSLTPKIIRRVLANSHFEMVSEDKYWLGYWGKHLKTSGFKTILPYQKVNHFPGAFHLGRKDKLWMNINQFMKLFASDYFDIMPKTYILPHDFKLLREKMKRDGQMTPYILKPPASARGTGVHVVHRCSHIPRNDKLIAQNYIENPYLISGSKFDLRLYVYVTSFDPLKIYLYEDGLVRFASVKYSKSLKHVANRLMHLTNYSLNKTVADDDCIPNKSETGLKWHLSKFWEYLDEQFKDVDCIKQNIVDLIIKTFICCDTPINSYLQQNLNFPFVCHELYGFDVVLDDKLKPWLLEVNISPSLHSATPVDLQVKSSLACDVLNLCGIQVPDKNQVQSSSARLSTEFFTPENPLTLNYAAKPHQGFILCNSNTTENAKRTKYVDSFGETKKTDHNILDDLTSNDLRLLIDLEDEYNRKGKFARIFPSTDTSKYLKYFQTIKYSNLLLDEWINQYYHIRETGLALIDSFCINRRHLMSFSCKVD